MQLPTTLLSAVDSSVGGKTAIDLAAGKNLAGAFLQPAAVLCDTDCLRSLPAAVFADGAAEAIKTGVLCDETLFALFEDGTLTTDPGEVIVRDAHVRGIPVVPVPAASAAVTALCVSGQPTGRFVFEGFLPTNRRQKKERLAALQNEERTVIFYEAPHKLPTTLQDLEQAFGPERSLTICRELTKLHEEIRVTTVGDASAYYKENPPRGEFVLVMAGAQPCPAQELTLDDAVGLARKQMAAGQSATAAAKYAAAHSAFSKSEIYRRCLE